MVNSFWQALGELPAQRQAFFFLALGIAFAFEFINGFHDTANAVTTVIYTRTLKPTPAVLFSGFCNFLGVLLGGTAVAFSIVHLLPVDLLIEASSTSALWMVMSLLVAGVLWNLGTWYLGLPVSSSHTLIGSILGVGLANSLLTRGDLMGVNWSKAGEVGLSLLISPVVGFLAAAFLLWQMKKRLPDPRLYVPPVGEDRPPRWVRATLVGTCGAVSLAHGSNDGQKGMGLILLVLIGFLPSFFALDLDHGDKARTTRQAAVALQGRLEASGRTVPEEVKADLATVSRLLEGKRALVEVPDAERWELRRLIYRLRESLKGMGRGDGDEAQIAALRQELTHAIEYVPYWVVIGVALALGVGTTVGYKRIVVTVAEKIGKTHLTYAQGAAAEVVAAATIALADTMHLPVSTTQVLSSGVAGTMWANNSGIQARTMKRIGLAWVLTLPASILLAAGLFTITHLQSGGVFDPSAKVLHPAAVMTGPGRSPIPLQKIKGISLNDRGRERSLLPVESGRE